MDLIITHEQAYLSVFVQNVPKEAEGVGEALRSCTLLHTHHTMLLRVQHTTLWVWPSGQFHNSLGTNTVGTELFYKVSLILA